MANHKPTKPLRLEERGHRLKFSEAENSRNVIFKTQSQTEKQDKTSAIVNWPFPKDGHFAREQKHEGDPDELICRA